MQVISEFEINTISPRDRVPAECEARSPLSLQPGPDGHGRGGGGRAARVGVGVGVVAARARGRVRAGRGGRHVGGICEVFRCYILKVGLRGSIPFRAEEEAWLSGFSSTLHFFNTFEGGGSRGHESDFFGHY